MQNHNSHPEISPPLTEEVGSKYNSDMFFAVTADGQYIEASQAYCELMQYSQNELFAMTLHDVQVEGFQATPINFVQSVENNAFARVRMEQRARDGQPISFVSSVFVAAVNQKIYCFITHFQTIPKPEESLKLSLELANRVIKHSSDLILITEAEPYHWPGPRIVYANDALLKQTGYSLEEVLGQTPRIFHGPNTNPETTHRIHVALAQWQPIREEVLNYTKEGEEFWQELNIFPVANEDGWFTHWVSIQRNITRRKTLTKTLIDTQTALEESSQRLNLAMSAGGVGIWDWDVLHDVLVWDEQMYAMYGVHADTFSGAYEAWQKGLHPDDREQAEQAIMDAIQTGEFKTEFRIFRPDGDIRHIRGHARTIKNGVGAVIRMIGVNWDITDEKLVENKIQELAFFDHLTMLANRRLFSDRLNRAVILSRRKKHSFALLSIDLDNFKMVNDLHGHSGGDLVLQATAQILLSAVRAGDTVARTGGDEFMILLEELGVTNSEADLAARKVAEKIFSSLNDSRKKNPSLALCSISIGVATSFWGKQEDLADLIKRSDHALYKAKQLGRNCIQFYDEELQSSINATTSLLTSLHQSIKNEWFVLHYQPQIDNDGHIRAAEVLLRLDHPELGLLAPSEFMHLAESSDLIVPIGWWVINEACAQLATWSRDETKSHIALSINISIKQFQQENFVVELINIVVKHEVNPKLITLELTESLFLADLGQASFKMKSLKEFGFSFSLDDFGTGYSSLSYLKSLPFDELKIDKIFVSEIPEDKMSCDIVRIVISMAQTLGLKVIAEGVENDEQLRYLKAIGCNLHQGYLLSPPLCLDAFLALVEHVN